MKIREIFKYIKFSFATIFRNAKSYFFSSLFLKSILTSKVYIIAYINKLILNELFFAITSNSPVFSAITALAKILIINWAVILGYNFCENLLRYWMASSMMDYSLIMNQNLYKKLTRLDVSWFDIPQQNDKVKQSFKDMEGIVSLFDCTLNTFFSVVSWSIAIKIVFSFNWLVSIIVILALIPSFWIKKHIKETNYQQEKDLNLLNRKTEYFANLFFNKNAAQDFKLFQMPSLILRKHRVFSVERNNQKRKLRKKNTILEIVFSAFMGLVNIGINIYILFIIIAQKLSIGDFTYYTTITAKLRQSVEDCFSNLNDIIISSKKVKNYNEFMSQSNEVYIAGAASVPSGENEFSFRHVFFRYPGSKSWVLQDVSFTFKSNQKVALAGINGAGKSTIIKLLLRFYDPTKGDILLNGTNVKEFDLKEYRKQFSVMFQNYMNYKMPIRDNITCSEDVDIGIDYKIKQVLRSVGLENIDINSEYTKTFNKDGVILSSGQAQRLNLARTIFREASTFILDEPSASLDAKAEQEVFDNVFELTKQNKGLILISHRLSNLQLVDKIIYLAHGMVVESGTHQQLYDKKGEYFELYDIQSKKYII